jgi:transcriptional regulator NrdR family protein
VDKKRGGTKMHCRFCRDLTVCASLPYDRGEQIDRLSDIDLWYFARLRECQKCGNQFETIEVNSLWINDIEAEIWSLKADLEERVDKALGANQLILSWASDLELRIHSIENNLEDLRALKEKIKLATERSRFLKTPKE